MSKKGLDMKRNAALLVFLTGAYCALPTTAARADGRICWGDSDCFELAFLMCEGNSHNIYDFCCCNDPGGGTYCEGDCIDDPPPDLCQTMCFR